MYNMLFYTTSLGPLVGDSTAVYAPLLRYKKEALAAHSRLSKAKGGQTQHKLGFTPNNPILNLLRAQAMQHTVDVGYYAPAARTTLNLLCSSCSSSEIELVLANPEYSPSGLRRVHSATRLWFTTPRHLARQVGEVSWF